jgi:hypothetical protein
MNRGRWSLNRDSLPGQWLYMKWKKKKDTKIELVLLKITSNLRLIQPLLYLLNFPTQ